MLACYRINLLKSIAPPKIGQPEGCPYEEHANCKRRISIRGEGPMPDQSERQTSASIKTFSSQCDITTGQIERIM